MTTTLAPGCNMPSVPYSPERPDLWYYEVTGQEDGTVKADLAGEGTRVTDRFAHLAFFPTWSSGEVAFFTVKPGQKVRLDASAENTLQVTTDQGVVTFPGKILVVAHESVKEGLAAFYAPSSD